MANLYANENFPRPVVLELRKLGHDVVTIQERGGAGQSVPDRDVLTLAAEEERAILTLNRRDFIQLARLVSDQHAGIVACTIDSDFEGQAHRIHEAIAGEASLAGKVLRVNRPP